MPEIKRPVFFSGENPGITLYGPGTEEVMAVASYWHCTDSPFGVGHALILWVEGKATTDSGPGPGGIFTDNMNMARVVVNNLTQYFPEFRNVPVATLTYYEADCRHAFDGEIYQATCKTQETIVEMTWSELLDRKQVIWPHFPAGTDEYDLTTVICPCQSAHIRVNGNLINGEVKASKSKEGHFSSTAFLAFAETWIGPL